MRISSMIRVVEDLSIGAASKLSAASRRLYDDLELEARARRATNRELKAAKAQMIADFREAIIETDKRYAERRAANVDLGDR